MSTVGGTVGVRVGVDVFTVDGVKDGVVLGVDVLSKKGGTVGV